MGFFDVGGVILNDDKVEVLRQQTLLRVVRIFLPEATMDDVYHAWMEASILPGSVRINALRILMKNSPKLHEAESEYVRLCVFDYHGLSTVRTEAKAVLAKLSQRFKLGTTANQSVKTIDLLEQADLLKYVTHQKMSAHIGLEKPDPNFFKSILEDTGAKAEESVIIDDNWFRGLVPARNISMTTVLYKRKLIPFPEDANPDYTIESLVNIVKFLT